MASTDYSSEEMMTIAAARELHDHTVCFVGIGVPSAASNLARVTHAPSMTLVYEAGTIGSKPSTLPLSIGDGGLAETADVVVSVPEIFNYWLQPGRIDIGLLTGAQIDRFGNLNTTMVGGNYRKPVVRLPGAGGAPEIAASCKEIVIVMRQSPRVFVERLDFRTSVGFGSDRDDRARLGMIGRGPRRVVTDIGILAPDPVSVELTLVSLHPGQTVEGARAATGWQLRVSDRVARSEPPSVAELTALRELRAR